MLGRPRTCACLNKIMDAPSSLGTVSWGVFLHHVIRGLSTTLCRAGPVTSQVRACVPRMALLMGKPVLAGLAVPTDDLLSLAGNHALD